MEHLKRLLNDTKTHDDYSHLYNATSHGWASRSDVLAKFDDHIGKLTVGFGAENHFGPELELGWYVVRLCFVLLCSVVFRSSVMIVFGRLRECNKLCREYANGAFPNCIDSLIAKRMRVVTIGRIAGDSCSMSS